MDDLEPPKHTARPITVIGDGAKSAQAASFLFLPSI
jgi:hypothetical protein